MLLAVDLHDYFIDEEGIAVATMSSPQASGVQSAELYTPEADCLATDDDASLSEQIFDIKMTQLESIVEPDGVGNDIGWGRA